jgi:hypothetical protein
MTFELHVENESFVRVHMADIQQKLTTALTLFVQQMQDDERKRTTPIGKGISGDASVETARVQERLRLEHEQNFGTEEQRQRRVKEIQDATRANHMVREK